MKSIGQLRESPLHADLKTYLSGPGDRFEVPLEGFVIDLVRADGELVEVQTGSFWPLRPKLERLLDFHRMRVVHPILAERQVVRAGSCGEILSKRRSPVRGSYLDVFERLVSIPTLLSHPNFTLEVVLCREEHWRGSKVKVRRGRTEPGERRLVGVTERREFCQPQDVLSLLPDLTRPFTTIELGDKLHCGKTLAQRIVYCLKNLELVRQVGKTGRSSLYQHTEPGS